MTTPPAGLEAALAAEHERLTVAVLTYRRNADLAELLPMLVEQARPLRDRHSVRVLVIDNDPAGGARQIVAAIAPDGPDPVLVQYAHETTPGIAAARNRALDLTADGDLLVFIDDDERPSEHWLLELLATRARYRAVAVAGPVVSRFAVEPDPWIRAGRFFERRRMPTGSAISVAATNNLLLDLRADTVAGLRFDPATGATGGEDTLFTRTIHGRGGRMVWCDEAVVTDVVPANRATRRWVVRRAYSSGNSWGIVALRTNAGYRRIAMAAGLHVAAGVRIAGGGARYAAGRLTRRDADSARGLRTAARGLGLLAGLWNVQYREYGRPPG